MKEKKRKKERTTKNAAGAQTRTANACSCTDACCCTQNRAMHAWVPYASRHATCDMMRHAPSPLCPLGLSKPTGGKYLSLSDEPSTAQKNKASHQVSIISSPSSSFLSAPFSNSPPAIYPLLSPPPPLPYSSTLLNQKSSHR